MVEGYSFIFLSPLLPVEYLWLHHRCLKTKYKTFKSQLLWPTALYHQLSSPVCLLQRQPAPKILDSHALPHNHLPETSRKAAWGVNDVAQYFYRLPSNDHTCPFLSTLVYNIGCHLLTQINVLQSDSYQAYLFSHASFNASKPSHA